MDIRDALYEKISSLTTLLFRIADNQLCSHVIHDPDKIVSNVNELHAALQIIYKITFDNKNVDIRDKKSIKIFGNNYVLILKYIKKILYKYENKNINDQILKYVNYYLKFHFDNIFDLFDKINLLITKIKTFDLNPTTLKIDQKFNYAKHTYDTSTTDTDNAIFDFYKLIELLYVEILYLFVRYMDIFFLRRFLDKKYITHAVTYTGIAHSIAYIQTLVQDFDFKITHASYNYFNDINKLNKEIKNIKNRSDMENFSFQKS
jgi:hypothetical protein